MSRAVSPCPRRRSPPPGYRAPRTEACALCPGERVCVAASSGRNHSFATPSDVATNTSWRPSGDSANDTGSATAIRRSPAAQHLLVTRGVPTQTDRRTPRARRGRRESATTQPAYISRDERWPGTMAGGAAPLGDPPQLVFQVTSRLPSRVRIFRETLADHSIERGRS